MWEVVALVPSGRVATYGHIAALAGALGAARAVGWALASLPEGSPVPWHRVLNAEGRISRRGEPGWENVQRALLEAEGVTFTESGRVDLDRWGWEPQL